MLAMPIMAKANMAYRMTVHLTQLVGMNHIINHSHTDSVLSSHANLKLEWSCLSSGFIGLECLSYSLSVGILLVMARLSYGV